VDDLLRELERQLGVATGVKQRKPSSIAPSYELKTVDLTLLSQVRTLSGELAAWPEHRAALESRKHLTQEEKRLVVNRSHFEAFREEAMLLRWKRAPQVESGCSKGEPTQNIPCNKSKQNATRAVVAQEEQTALMNNGRRRKRAYASLSKKTKNLPPPPKMAAERWRLCRRKSGCARPSETGGCDAQRALEPA